VRDRALIHLLASGEAVVDLARDHPLGRLLLTPALPRVRALNRLVIPRSVEATHTLDAAELAAEARHRLFAEHGVPPSVTVLDERLGARLAPGFGALGWDVDENLVMVDSGTPLEAGGERVEEPPPAVLDRLRQRMHEEDSPVPDPERVAQLIRRSHRCARQLEGRVFTAPRGEPAALAELYQRDGVGQIELVETLAHARRAGLGGTVLRAAISASRAGNDITLIVADVNDWPRRWYERLGFEPVARTWELEASE
jgi:ribosomal protein S18 acetylase RimI-like enzyme